MSALGPRPWTPVRHTGRVPARLIVNADDFGLTPGVNRAILELYRAGALSSATLMARGAAFKEAAELARAHPGLGVGCHVVLTDGVPVSPAGTIPTLLGKDGVHFRASLRDFLWAVARGRVSAAELRREIIAQIETLQCAGLPVTHLDTHKHTHVLPAIARALLEAAEITGVHAVRNPFEESWSLRLGHPGRGHSRPMRLLAVAGTRLFRASFLNLPAIRTGRVLTTHGTVGISATGGLNGDTLQRLLNAMPEGTWELVCHPGFVDRDLDCIPTRLRESREIERRALLAAFSRITPPHPPPRDLIHYGRLSAPAPANDTEQPA